MPPRGGQQVFRKSECIVVVVSSHAPARGATPELGNKEYVSE